MYCTKHEPHSLVPHFPLVQITRVRHPLALGRDTTVSPFIGGMIDSEHSNLIQLVRKPIRVDRNGYSVGD